MVGSKLYDNAVAASTVVQDVALRCLLSVEDLAMPTMVVSTQNVSNVPPAPCNHVTLTERAQIHWFAPFFLFDLCVLFCFVRKGYATKRNTRTGAGDGFLETRRRACRTRGGGEDRRP